MSKKIVLEQALILPASDITAMLQGKLIVAIPKVQISKGLSFLLAPEQSVSQTELSERYRSPFLSLPEISNNTSEEGVTHLEAWATCEHIKMIHDVDHFSTLSSSTIWNKSYLEELLKAQQHLFLTYLKVCRLPYRIGVPSEKIPIGKTGKFVDLLSMECSSVQVDESLPILSDHLFEQRKKKLEELTPPEYTELEIFQSSIEHYARTNFEAKHLDHELKVLLGWADSQAISLSPDWIKEITTSGNSSDGDLFEKRVRQGFLHLGFTNTLNNPKASLNPEATGGAGGIDIYCQKPFSIVGECKASQGENVPGGVVTQLNTLGQNYLGKKIFESSVKIIFAAGKLTSYDKNAANQHEINVMTPETLQRLVNLKYNHPGAIDLVELESCLRRKKFGIESDKKVNEFIDQVEQTIKLRSYIVQSVKALREHGDILVSASNVRTHFNTAFAEKLNTPPISVEQAHGFLVELSSPLTGYLGRNQCDVNWKGDRFYYLRDLILPNSQI
jgi:hypothetical protein